MNVKFNIFFKIACASMGAGVILGARFGHQGQLSEEGSALFAKAQVYNMSNSLGLFACSMVNSGSIPLKIAAGGFIAGQLLFITPLFISAIHGRQPIFAKIVPVGGVSVMTAWGALLFA